MSLTIQYIIIGAIFALLGIIVIRRMFFVKNKKSCNSGCSSCPLLDNCNKPQNKAKKVHEKFAQSKRV